MCPVLCRQYNCFPRSSYVSCRSCPWSHQNTSWWTGFWFCSSNRTGEDGVIRWMLRLLPLDCRKAHLTISTSMIWHSRRGTIIFFWKPLCLRATSYLLCTWTGLDDNIYQWHVERTSWHWQENPFSAEKRTVHICGRQSQAGMWFVACFRVVLWYALHHRWKMNAWR